MIVNLEAQKKGFCPFCGIKLYSKSFKTCDDPKCIAGWKDYKLYKNNRIWNCEFAKRRKTSKGKIRIFCEKNKYAYDHKKEGYSFTSARYHSPKACLDCEEWSDAAEYKDGIEEDFAKLMTEV